VLTNALQVAVESIFKDIDGGVGVGGGGETVGRLAVFALGVGRIGTWEILFDSGDLLFAINKYPVVLKDIMLRNKINMVIDLFADNKDFNLERKLFLVPVNPCKLFWLSINNMIT